MADQNEEQLARCGHQRGDSEGEDDGSIPGIPIG
jgi:hypothetical protein